MESDSGKTVSLWFATTQMPEYGALEVNERTDVCVVGAGISGLTTALLLAQEGRNVILVDDGPIGGGETGRTTAHLANALDDRYYQLEQLHGAKGARLAAESHTAAIDQIEKLVTTYAVSCDFRRVDGYLFEPLGGKPENIDREYHAARRAGLPVETVPKAPVPFETGRALKFPRQAQFHPLRYLRGLAEHFQRLRGRIYTGTHVREVQGGRPARVVTAQGKLIEAASVVVATNAPMNDQLIIHSKQAPYRTYAVGLAIPRGSVEPALVWDNASPYHYVRLGLSGPPESAEDILIVGGEDHKTGQNEDYETPFNNLIRWAQERYPMAREMVYRWSGQVLEPVDSLAYIGRNPMDHENVYVITGDSGHGMTHGTLGGMLIADLILGRENPWATLYDPKRKSFAKESIKEYARENLNVAAQYTELVQPGEVKTADEIPPGEGAILRHGTHLVAVYRNPSGVLVQKSAICPHLGCVIHWNSLEKTWDCPCHGSRFDKNGNVVNGPASGALAKA